MRYPELTTTPPHELQAALDAWRARWDGPYIDTTATQEVRMTFAAKRAALQSAAIASWSLSLPPGDVEEMEAELAALQASGDIEGHEQALDAWFVTARDTRPALPGDDA